MWRGNKKLRDFIFVFILTLFIFPFPAFSQDSGGENPSPPPTPGIQCQEGQAPDDSGNCQDLPKLCGQAKGFLPLNFEEYNLSFDEIKEKYKDKFPFNFLYFEASLDNNSECPVFIISGRNIPFCLPLEILRLAKYPALIGWIIWLVTNL